MESSNVQVFDIVKVSHVEARFSSYKITISVADRDSVFNESFWPAGVKCQWWREKIQRDYESDTFNTDEDGNDSEAENY